MADDPRDAQPCLAESFSAWRSRVPDLQVVPLVEEAHLDPPLAGDRYAECGEREREGEYAAPGGDPDPGRRHHQLCEERARGSSPRVLMPAHGVGGPQRKEGTRQHERAERARV